MKTLNIINNNQPSIQWRTWVAALESTDLEVKSIDFSELNPDSFSALSGHAILLDGMLPQLSQFASYIHWRHPAMQIIVATEFPSFTISYEVLHISGAKYVSGPLSADQFVETIFCYVATHEHEKVS